MKYIKTYENNVIYDKYEIGDYVKNIEPKDDEIYKIVDVEYNSFKLDSKTHLRDTLYFIQPWDDLDDQEDTVQGYWTNEKDIVPITKIESDELKLKIATDKYNL